jgi:hypothetical protein
MRITRTSFHLFIGALVTTPKLFYLTYPSH